MERLDCPVGAPSALVSPREAAKGKADVVGNVCRLSAHGGGISDCRRGRGGEEMRKRDGGRGALRPSECRCVCDVCVSCV